MNKADNIYNKILNNVDLESQLSDSQIMDGPGFKKTTVRNELKT